MCVPVLFVLSSPAPDLGLQFLEAPVPAPEESFVVLLLIYLFAQKRNVKNTNQDICV